MDINSANSWYSLAWILRSSPIPDQFLQGGVAARKAIELDDRDEYRLLAAALAMGGSRFAEAQTDYFTLLERNPDNAYYYYWFGLSRLAEGKCDGREAIVRAINILPNWGEAHVVLVRADALCGNLDAAESRLKLLAEKTDDADIRLARAYLSLFSDDSIRAKEIAEPELPNPDAQLIMNALDVEAKPTHLFSADSSWWIPPELN